MELLIKKTQKNTPKFFCESCNFNCIRNAEWKRHLATTKHKKLIMNPDKLIKNTQTHECTICNKIYKSSVGLWKHKKICINTVIDVENVVISMNTSVDTDVDVDVDTDIKLTTIMNDNDELKKLILQVIKTNIDIQKQNQDLQEQVSTVCKNIQPITISNNNNSKTINSHNKNFNLNFFLNEQCKDAMNIMDFVNTFQLQLSDLERIGEVGYVEGISTIVIDKLNQMDVHKRPIHCSDAKRETMHVKDNDVWTKDTAANDKIRLALKHITKKNTDMIRPWLNAHPGVLNSEHRLNDKYQEMFIEAMGGRKNKNMKEGEDKIIKKICKMVLIDKNM